MGVRVCGEHSECSRHSGAGQASLSRPLQLRTLEITEPSESNQPSLDKGRGKAMASTGQEVAYDSRLLLGGRKGASHGRLYRRSQCEAVDAYVAHATKATATYAEMEAEFFLERRVRVDRTVARDRIRMTNLPRLR